MQLSNIMLLMCGSVLKLWWLIATKILKVYTEEEKKNKPEQSKSLRLCLHVLLSCLGVAAFTEQQADKRACKYRAE